MITYFVVSEAPDLGESKENLKRAGRRIHEHGQRLRARDVLTDSPAGRRFIVVAHGDQRGVVYRHCETTNSDEPWLWPGMEEPPSGVRAFLYSCHAGSKISGRIAGCELLGHTNVVPMPVDFQRSTVIWFLKHVEKFLAHDPFDSGQVLRILAELVERRLAQCAEKGTQESFGDVLTLLTLRRSLE